MLSSTPSRLGRPEGFPPSYFGNRLAGEDPVRQSRHPEPTADPGPVQEEVVVEQREHAALIRHPHPSVQTDTHSTAPTRPHPHTQPTVYTVHTPGPTKLLTDGWCYRGFPTGPAMWPLLRTTLTAGVPLISIQRPRSLLMLMALQCSPSPTRTT